MEIISWVRVSAQHKHTDTQTKQDNVNFLPNKPLFLKHEFTVTVLFCLETNSPEWLGNLIYTTKNDSTKGVVGCFSFLFLILTLTCLTVLCDLHLFSLRHLGNMQLTLGNLKYGIGGWETFETYTVLQIHKQQQYKIKLGYVVVGLLWSMKLKGGIRT